MFQLFWRQPRTSVPDAHTNASLRALVAFYLDSSVLAVVFNRIGKQVDEHLLHPGSIGMDKVRNAELGKGQFDAMLLRLRFAHGLTFKHDFGQRHGLS